jgi:hypothetical protein
MTDADPARHSHRRGPWPAGTRAVVVRAALPQPKRNLPEPTAPAEEAALLGRKPLSVSAIASTVQGTHSRSNCVRGADAELSGRGPVENPQVTKRTPTFLTNDFTNKHERGEVAITLERTACHFVERS